MIELKNLSDKAKTILNDAIPHNSEGHESEEFMSLYKDFLIETNMKYKELGISGFRTAVVQNKRKQGRKDYETKRNTTF